MRVGIVVGAGGIGGEVARITRGAVEHLIVLDRDEEKVRRLHRELGVIGVPGDTSSAGAQDALLAQLRHLGHDLDWVVLASGVGARAAASEVEEGPVRAAFEANVIGPVLLLSRLLKHASWANPATIVGVGSISARRPLPGRTVYGATKAALEAFLTALGVEVARRGIRVNLVSPGVTDTGFIAPSRAQLEKWAAERVPAGRIGEAGEVAAVIAYLLLQAPSYLTCTRVVVDGGAEAMP